MSHVLLNLNLQWLGLRIPKGAYYPENMYLLLLLFIFFKENVFLLIIGLSTGSALFMVISSTVGASTYSY